MTNNSVASMVDRQSTAQKLDSLVWGLLLLWIGIALLTNLGWGIGLLGIGVLLLGEQAARAYAAVKFETFWVVVGLVFLFGGISELLSIRISPIPVACIVAGVVLLLSTLFGKPRD